MMLCKTLLFCGLLLLGVHLHAQPRPLKHEVIKVNKKTLIAESSFPMDRPFHIEVPGNISIPNTAVLSCRRTDDNPNGWTPHLANVTPENIEVDMLLIPPLLPRREYKIEWYTPESDSWDISLFNTPEFRNARATRWTNGARPVLNTAIFNRIVQHVNSRNLNTLMAAVKPQPSISDGRYEMAGTYGAILQKLFFLQSNRGSAPQITILGAITNGRIHLENIDSFYVGTPNVLLNAWMAYDNIQKQNDQLRGLRTLLYKNRPFITSNISVVDTMIALIEDYIDFNDQFIDEVDDWVNMLVTTAAYELRYLGTKSIRGSTSQAKFKDRVSNSIHSDIGIIFVFTDNGYTPEREFNIGPVLPVITTRLSFAPSDDTYPLRYTSHRRTYNRGIVYGISEFLWRRSTLDLGLSIGSVEGTRNIKYRTDLWNDFNIVAGYGFKITHGFSVGFGGLIHKEYLNPGWSSATRTVYSPYLNVSLSLKLEDLLTPILTRALPS